MPELEVCGKCERPTVAGDCYGCETDRLNIRNQLLQEEVEKVVRDWKNMMDCLDKEVNQAAKDLGIDLKNLTVRQKLTELIYKVKSRVDSEYSQQSQTF